MTRPWALSDGGWWRHAACRWMDIARKMRRRNKPDLPRTSPSRCLLGPMRIKSHITDDTDAYTYGIVVMRRVYTSYRSAYRICCGMTEELWFASSLIMQVLQMLVNRSVLPVNLPVSIWTGWERRRSGTVNGGEMERMDIDYTNAGHCKCYVCGHTCCLSQPGNRKNKIRQRCPININVEGMLKGDSACTFPQRQK